ncbi:2Fe-2S iron-sulfur cluster-binding protein [Streptomyces sp. NPDC007189]|uniref:2Fe-2S iron-sulfur cluster-binding protein n=1 Tax=Streptomyces sp. NPDC007189 TaxID=3154315 RepID=UPI003453D138
MTDDQHGEGTPQGGGRWDPLPQGDYDDGATAFVKLPEGGIDALLNGESPLAAPGHGYVPPQIAVAPGTDDPAATGNWSAPAGGAEWPDPNAGRQSPQADDRFTYSPGATQHWTFEEPAAPPAPGHDVTGQWSIPVAGGDLPDESGEFTTSSLVEQWGGTPPATLPGGAPAPWATDAPGPWNSPAEPGHPGLPDHTDAHPSGDAPARDAYARDDRPEVYAREERYGHAPAAYAETGRPATPHTESLDDAGGRAETGHGEPGQGEYGAEYGHDGADGAEFGHDGAGRAESGRPEFGQDPAGHAESGPAAANGRAEPSDAHAPVDAHAPAQAPDGAAEARADHEGPADHGAAPQAATTADTAGAQPPAAHGTPAAHPDPAAAHRVEAGAPEHAADAAAPHGTREEPAGEPGEGPTGESAEAPAADPAPDSAEAPASAQADGDETGEEAAVPLPRHDDHPLASYVLRVNGVDRPVSDAWIGESLLYVLRERLGLAGAKDGCSQGECGACNVQVDGRLVASCLVPAATAAGSEVRTVEGLAADGQPSDVQRALARCGAVQCGFCVPGMAMTVHDLLEGNPAPSELETRQALCGNLCRCSGYRGVLDAVKEVVAEREASHAADAETDADEARIPHQAGPGAGGVHPSAFEAPGAFDTPHTAPGGYADTPPYGTPDPYGTPPHGTPGPHGEHDPHYGQDGGQA